MDTTDERVDRLGAKVAELDAMVNAIRAVAVDDMDDVEFERVAAWWSEENRPAGA